MVVDVQVPPNATARVVLNGVDEEIGSGSKQYEVPYTADERWPPKGLEGPQWQQMSDEFVP